MYNSNKNKPSNPVIYNKNIKFYEKAIAIFRLKCYALYTFGNVTDNGTNTNTTILKERYSL